MALDYYNNDYTGANLNTFGAFNPSGYTDQFGGLVKTLRWHSQTDNHVGRAYAYKYDNLDRFTTANWGSVNGSSGNYSFSPAAPLAYQEAIGSYDRNGNISTLTRNGQLANSLANFGYTYKGGTNQLTQVTNGGSSYLGYQYNAIGQMTQQTQGANTMNVAYNAYGLIKEIRDVNSILTAAFAYDDRGNRLKKTTYKSDGTTPKHTTWYATDAAGNIMAVYESNGTNAIQLTEVSIYGGSRLGMYKPAEQTYFYEVTDHLGNVRGVIGNPSPLTFTATLETSTQTTEQATFFNYSRTSGNSSLFNHTPGGSYAQLLNGGYTGQIGLAKSLSVMPGDVISADVYAKYWNVTSNSSNLGGFATALLSAFGLSVPAQGETGTAASAMNSYGGFVAGGGYSSDGAPKGFLTILTFDNDYNLVNANTAYQQITTAALQPNTPVPPPSTPHEHLSKQVTITQPGFVYIFVSNEDPYQTDIYFDDLTITHQRSKIVAGSDYYPFGLAMENRSITRESYRYAFQGQYSEMDSVTKWNAFELRMYDPSIGRWLSPDPYGQFSSPYLAMGNNPISGADPNGGICCEELFSMADILPEGVTPIVLDGANITPEWDFAMADALLREAPEGAGSLLPGIPNGGKQVEFNMTFNGPVNAQPPVASSFSQAPAASSFSRSVDLSIPKAPMVTTISPPGTLESLIPIWGSGREAAAAFSAGNYWTGAFFTAMAISDVFLVKAIATAGVRALGKVALSNEELIYKAGQKAFENIAGKGGVVGTARHTYAGQLVRRYQSIYGSRGLEVERSFNINGWAGRLDVWDSRNLIIYDWKFGSATMKAAQKAKYIHGMNPDAIVIYHYPY